MPPSEQPPTVEQLQREIAALAKRVDDLYHRFRLAFIGYLLLSALALTAVTVNYFQDKRIDRSERQTNVNSIVIGHLLADDLARVCVAVNELRQNLVQGPITNCEQQRREIEHAVEELARQ